MKGLVEDLSSHTESQSASVDDNGVLKKKKIFQITCECVTSHAAKGDRHILVKYRRLSVSAYTRPLA